MSDITLSDVMSLYVQTKREKDELTTQIDILDSRLKDIEAAVLESLPADVDRQQLTLPTGDRVSFGRAVTKRIQPEGGKSDEFYAWVKANNATELLERRIAQGNAEAWAKEHGQVLPYTEVVNKVSLSVRVTKATPKSGE